MDFNLTNEQRLIQRAAREFAQREIEPIASQVDRSGQLPPDMLKKMAAARLLGMEVPRKYGGTEAGIFNLILALEQIGYPACACESLMGINNMTASTINHFGNEEQKQKYIPPLCKGEVLGGLQFTEPSTGSDPRAITTTAVLQGDYYIINGTKRFMTHGDKDGPAILFARDDSGKISTFIVEKNCTGYSSSKPWELLGLAGQGAVDVTYNNAKIHKSNVFGTPGKGMDVLFAMVGGGRLEMCAWQLGICQAAMDEAIKYAKEKTVREKPLGNMQAIQYLLVEIATRVEACRWLTYRTAFMADQGADVRKDASLAKIFVTTSSCEITDMALQVHGPYGYTKDFKVERLYRYARAGQIIEGVTEIQRSIVASFLLQ